MKIETPGLIIRPFQEKDADALYRIKTDPRVMEYCPDFLDVDAKREDMPDYIRTFRKLEEDGDFDTWRCYAIENKVTGEVMGAITFCKQNILTKRCFSVSNKFTIYAPDFDSSASST